MTQSFGILNACNDMLIEASNTLGSLMELLKSSVKEVPVLHQISFEKNEMGFETCKSYFLIIELIYQRRVCLLYKNIRCENWDFSVINKKIKINKKNQ